MRAIDADALRDRLQNLGYDDWNQGTTTTWAEAFNECADIVDEQPTIEPERQKGKWIPCSERLPEPQTEVVVSFDNGEVKILWQDWAAPSSLSNYPGEPLAYIGGDGIPHTYEEWESMKTYAVAWMPLPEPYRED